MKCTIFAAVSTDNYIADSKNEQKWTSAEDTAFLKTALSHYDVYIMGTNTFLQHKSKFINKTKIRVVLTSRPKYYQKLYKNSNVLFTNNSLKQVVSDYSTKSIAILGGSSVYTQALTDQVCSDMYITHENVTLGSGTPFIQDASLMSRFTSGNSPLPAPKSVIYYKRK